MSPKPVVEPAEPKTVIVNGTTYYLTLLPSWDVLELTPLVGKLLAPGIAALAKFADPNAAAQAVDELDLTGLGDALEKTMKALTAAELRQLSAKVLTGCLVVLDNGNTVPLMPMFNTHFQGKPFAMLKLIAGGVAANFGDFTEGLRTLAARAASKLKPLSAPTTKSSTSEPESSGPPGE